MKSRLILAPAFILSVALSQPGYAAPAPARADQEQLLAAERARLETARAELAAQAAATAAPPSASRAAPAPLSPDVTGAPAAPAAADSAATAPNAAVPGAQPQPGSASGVRPPAAPPVMGSTGPVGGPSAGSLLQTILALSFVLALLAGLAWFMKRFGARALMGGSVNLRIVGSLNLGGRERLMVVEVGDQWIVVGASPGRVNALATMPKQESAEQSATLAGHMPAASSFAEWLKQTIDKRNGK
ncbi:MAG TPA: flagellar biosynthetic protein FliO [Telluria sp.]